MSQLLHEATQIKPGRYAVRPSGCLGTIGFINGQCWTVRYINAASEAEALKKAGVILPYAVTVPGAI